MILFININIYLKDNHDEILNGNFENCMFKKEWDILHYLKLTHNFLVFGI